MPRYTYQSAPGLRIKAAVYRGSAQDFADALAEDCRADYGVAPNVRVWHGDGPVTEPPAATAR